MRTAAENGWREGWRKGERKKRMVIGEKEKVILQRRRLKHRGRK